MDSRAVVFGTVLVFTLGLAVDAARTFRVFNVISYGANPDGKTDNSKAFLSAWNDACKWKGKGIPTVWVPQGAYMVSVVQFKGPCEGPMTFSIQGLLKAPTDPELFKGDTWLVFQYIQGLVLEGGGTLDGQGASAWPLNDCNKNPQCVKLPISLRFDFVSNAIVRNIHSINSKNAHINVFACNDMLFKGVKLTAPGNSPNTDGIKIGASKNIQISRSVIATGDDCVAMVSGSQKIGIDNVACGPGHGISIGSLGKSKDEFVSDIHIRRCSLSGTQNGLRIKTWADSFQGKVSNVIFEDVEMNNVNNPLFIDQQYCPSGHCSSESTSSVEIRNVTFKNIWGTSSSSEAVIMDCSLTNPCQDVKLVDINLDYSGNGATTSQCSNVHGNADGEQRPPGCLR